MISTIMIQQVQITQGKSHNFRRYLCIYLFSVLCIFHCLLYLTNHVIFPVPVASPMHVNMSSCNLRLMISPNVPDMYQTMVRSGVMSFHITTSNVIQCSWGYIHVYVYVSIYISKRFCKQIMFSYRRWTLMELLAG
jgi:hypothetical protein